MKQKILAGFLIFTCLFSFAGCSDINYKKVSKDVEDNKNNDNSNKDFLPDIKASYGVAKLKDSLINRQNKYNNKELIYYEVYSEKDNLDKKVKEYGINYDNPLENIFDEEYFNNYLIIAIYPGVISSSSKYEIIDISKVKIMEEDRWSIKIRKNTSSKSSEVDVNPVVFISIKRKLYEKVNAFDIELLSNVAVKTLDFKSRVYLM